MDHDPPQLSWTAGFLSRARAVDARVANRPDVIPDDLGGPRFPRFVSSAEGAFIWDIDGNRYTDFLMGFGPVILGHRHPEVTEAATRALERGHCFAPLWSPLQVDLCELLTQVVPGAESAFIVKTGSDATSTAVRLARIATGRDVVLRWGYNGWHDWANDHATGIPESVRGLTHRLSSVGLREIEGAFEANRDKVACLVMMPFHEETTTSSHVASIRDTCHANGALLILDEMRSGFRVALGGAQQMLGVNADLVAIGKAMGNGYSISAVCGGRALLDGLSQTKISSSYFANPADIAAALATIAILRETDALAHIWRLGDQLQKGVRDLVEAHDVPAAVLGYPPMPMLRFQHEDDLHRRAFTHHFYSETTRRGVLFHPDHQWFISAAHTSDDIDNAIDVVDEALSATNARLVSQ